MPRRVALKRKVRVERPDIFRYQDYRAFLRDWLEYLGSKDLGFSLKGLGERAGITGGYLSMILSGARVLSIKAFFKLSPHLQLNGSELGYFENLVKLAEFQPSNVRFSAVDQMSKYSTFQKLYPDDARFIEFMGKWYHSAIREMAALPGFRPDPEEIRARLNFNVPLSQVRDALEFLLSNGYLKINPDGTLSTTTDETLKCQGEVFTAVSTEYHKQMFTLAGTSTERNKPDERDVEGFTVAFNRARLEKARAIIQRAFDEIEQLQKTIEDGPNDSVYQVQLALFPLVGRKGT